jgi:hypothetical protein
MTNQNPASSNPQSAKLSQEILSKVNAHADRSIDRLFADIDELLSGDLSGDIPPASTQQQYRYPPASGNDRRTVDPQRQQPQPQQYLPQGDFTPPPEKVEPPQQPQQTPQAKPKRQKPQSMPLWMKVFLGIGVTSIALSSLLLWLINERKIQLPKNMDVSWLPFMSQSQISSDDAKFAEYMRKSISKIESANTQASTAPAQTNAAPAPTDAATSPTAVSSPTSTISANPGVITTKPDPAASQIPISLIKTLPTGDRPGAIFEINSQTQTVYAGDKIGKSDWSLLTVAKGEVIVKKVGGVIRSIYVGQKF